MNKKLSAVLRGIASLVIAGYISFIPAFTSLAAPYNLTNNSFSIDDIRVYDLRPNGIFDQDIPGTVNFSFHGIDMSNPLNLYRFSLRIEADGRVKLWAYCEFGSEIGSGDNGYAAYNFSYAGINYNGVLSMSPINSHGLYRELWGNLSDFANSNNDGLNEFNKSINNKIDDIGLADQGLNHDGSENPEKTVYYDFNGAISEKIIRALAQSEGVTFIYTFEYEGYIFRSTITSETARKIWSPDIPWYGPCYIACNCPTEFVSEAAK